MNDPYDPAKIDVERDEGVTVTYLDGYIVSFDLLTLRERCPCAFCRGIRDQGEEVWPRTGSPTPLRIVDARIHGAWGLAITWNDGHATGICSVAPFGISGSLRWMKAAAVGTGRAGLERQLEWRGRSAPYPNRGWVWRVVRLDRCVGELARRGGSPSRR